MKQTSKQTVKRAVQYWLDKSTIHPLRRWLLVFVLVLALFFLRINLVQSSSLVESHKTKYNHSQLIPPGPLPFCETAYTLYKTEMRDIICSSSIIQEPERSNIMFIHIPKTGGESLEKSMHLVKSHQTWWDHRQWYSGGRSGLVVTIIRNPFDRMLSWFKFCLHGWNGVLPGPAPHCLKAHEAVNYHGGPHNDSTVSLAFEEWIKAMVLNPKFVHPWLTYPNQAFLGGIAPLHVDFIIRFEHYAEDFYVLAHALGINTTISHENSSSGAAGGKMDGHNKFNISFNEEVGALLSRPYRELYTDTAKKLVELQYASDLLAFNYTF